MQKIAVFRLTLLNHTGIAAFMPTVMDPYDPGPGIGYRANPPIALDGPARPGTAEVVQIGTPTRPASTDCRVVIDLTTTNAMKEATFEYRCLDARRDFGWRNFRHMPHGPGATDQLERVVSKATHWALFGLAGIAGHPRPSSVHEEGVGEWVLNVDVGEILVTISPDGRDVHIARVPSSAAELRS